MFRGLDNFPRWLSRGPSLFVVLDFERLGEDGSVDLLRLLFHKRDSVRALRLTSGNLLLVVLFRFDHGLFLR